jgi:hypothetical protein
MAADRPLTRIVMIGHAPATFPRKRIVNDFTSRGKRASANSTPGFTPNSLAHSVRSGPVPLELPGDDAQAV